MPTRKVICPYCDKPAELVDSSEIYRGQSYGMIWLCRPCDAYVGVHSNSKDFAPLGILANKTTREWRKAAHAMFDPLWKRKMARDKVNKSKARNSAYAWLAQQMDMPIEECHIAKFTVTQCKEVIAITKRYIK